MVGIWVGVKDDDGTPRLIGQTAADCKWRLKSLTEEGFSGWVTDRCRSGHVVKPKARSGRSGLHPKRVGF